MRIVDHWYQMEEYSESNWIELLKEAIDLSYYWHKDYLNCQESFQRQTAKVSLEDILNIIPNSRFKHFVAIDRQVVIPLDRPPSGACRYFEIGTRITCPESEIDYFLFIFLERETALKKLVTKYNLKTKG